MNANTTFLRSPLESILLVEEITRSQTGPFRSVSPPGHLLHLVLSGEVEQYADDRAQRIGPGTLIWYYQMESIHGRIVKAPWRFITINFIAPALPPPADTHRVRKARQIENRLVRSLLAEWEKRSQPVAMRALKCFSLLNQLLAMAKLPLAARDDDWSHLQMERWWRVERKIRLDLEHIPPLAQLAKQFGMNQRTLEKACVAATGLTPVRRIGALRITQARHLLQVTSLPISQIALMVGFPRVQELSRAMRKWTNQTPRSVRAAVRDYRNQ